MLAFSYLCLLLLLGGQSGAQPSQSLTSELNAEHDPAKRSGMALAFADAAFEEARDAYKKDDFEKGDAQLDNMTNALNACVDALEVTHHKSGFYKKAELKVAHLQRRMAGLLDDIDLAHRGWAEQTNRKLEEIHEKLLAGVMRK